MREGWQIKKLGETVIVERGSSPRPIKNFLTTEADGVNWIKIGDTKNVGKYIYSTKQKITKKGAEKSRFVDVGDFILTNSMSYGKPYIMKTQGYIHDGWFVFRLPENINSDFFWYLLISPNLKDQFESLAAGAIVKNISGDLVKKALLPIPPLHEQKAIVKILDEAFAKIDQAKANFEKNIENAKELFQSKLNEIFSHPLAGSGRDRGEGWEKVTLGEIGKVSMCKRILKKQTNTDSGIPFYKIGTFGKEANAFITEEIYQEFKNKYSFPKKGDVLISASGTIGRRVIYDGKPAYFQDSNIVWIDNNEEKVLNDYLYQFYGVCNWNPSKGATISRLYNDDLRRIKISYPNKIKQVELIAIMENLAKNKWSLLLILQKKIDNLDELKKSLLQKAFSGELTKSEAIA